uniref:Uncharacterized protein n=1 Tax=Chlorocebus sabaeus TaxID=60711 RepID=A0A0D9R4W6_CHLSB
MFSGFTCHRFVTSGQFPTGFSFLWQLGNQLTSVELLLWFRDRRSHGWPRCRGQNWFRGHCSSTDTCCAVAGGCRPRASSSITSMLSGRVFGFIQMKTTLRESSRLLKGPLKMLTGS